VASVAKPLISTKANIPASNVGAHFAIGAEQGGAYAKTMFLCVIIQGFFLSPGTNLALNPVRWLAHVSTITVVLFVDLV